MLAASRKILFNRILRCFLYFCNFLDRIAFHIEEQHRGALSGRKPVECGVEFLIFKRAVGSFGCDKLFRMVIADIQSFTPFVVQECVVADSINPHIKFFRIRKTATGEISLYIRFLRDIIGKCGIATTKSYQKAPGTLYW